MTLGAGGGAAHNPTIRSQSNQYGVRPAKACGDAYNPTIRIVKATEPPPRSAHSGMVRQQDL